MVSSIDIEECFVNRKDDEYYIGQFIRYLFDLIVYFEKV